MGLESHCEDTSNPGDTVAGLQQPPESGGHPQLSLWALQACLLEQRHPSCTRSLPTPHWARPPVWAGRRAVPPSPQAQTSPLLGGLPWSSWSTKLPLDPGPLETVTTFPQTTSLVARPLREGRPFRPHLYHCHDDKETAASRIPPEPSDPPLGARVATGHQPRPPPKASLPVWRPRGPSPGWCCPSAWGSGPGVWSW